MAKRFTYGVFYPKISKGSLVGQRWGRTNNKAAAIAAAKKGGGEVWAMPYAHGDLTYDAPTFEMGSKKIFPSSTRR